MGKAIDSPDDRGYTPDLTKIGTYWMHFKTNNVYTIYGFEYDAEHDVWVYRYKAHNSSDKTPYTRSPPKLS